MKSIDIKEVIKDKDTWFNVKKLNIEGLNDNASVKTFDLNNVNQEITSNLEPRNTIFEKSKLIRHSQTVSSIIKETDNEKIKSFFGWRRWLDDKFWISTLTFNFDPYSEFSNFDEIDGFLSYYYEFSKRFVFVPNIKKFKNVSAPDKPLESTKVEVIDATEYLKYVEECVHFFSSKNNKPIFVPISISFSIDEIKTIVSNYIKKERFYFWIDFESQPIDQVQTARVKTINNLFEKSNYFDKCISFFTNVKREIISKRKADQSPASDVLGTVYGANIIGVDREPQRRITQPLIKNQPSPIEIIEHKAREFDGKTYYYVKSKSPAQTKSQNVTINAMKLGSEFEKQRNFFLRNAEIASYLSTKQMIQNFSDGKILTDIRKTGLTQKKLQLI
jgi:hypothetical protein